MTFILHGTFAAAASAASLAAFFVLYHLYDNKYDYQSKDSYDGYIADIINYPIHIFLPFLTTIKNINAMTISAAISPIRLSPPVSAMPI